MIEDWLWWLEVERGALLETRRAYERDLRLLAELGEPAALDTEALRGFLRSRGGAPSTVARRLAALRSFYRYLTRAGIRADDPTTSLDRPKVRKGIPKPVKDIDERLRSFDAETRAIALFIVETGLRISEACAVDVEVPAPENLLVRGKGSKDRLIPLSPAARKALDHLGGRVRLSPRTIQKRFQSAGFTPHQLRHTLACDMAASGADLGEIQDMLGHASPATTRVYAAYSLDRLRRAIDRRPGRDVDL